MHLSYTIDIKFKSVITEMIAEYNETYYKIQLQRKYDKINDNLKYVV